MDRTFRQAALVRTRNERRSVCEQGDSFDMSRESVVRDGHWLPLQSLRPGPV